MRQAGPPEMPDPVACRRYHFEIGLESRLARSLQHRRPSGRILAPGSIHLLVCARKAEMQNPGVRIPKIEMVGA